MPVEGDQVGSDLLREAEVSRVSRRTPAAPRRLTQTSGSPRWCSSGGTREAGGTDEEDSPAACWGGRPSWNLCSLRTQKEEERKKSDQEPASCCRQRRQQRSRTTTAQHSETGRTLRHQLTGFERNMEQQLGLDRKTNTSQQLHPPTSHQSDTRPGAEGGGRPRRRAWLASTTLPCPTDLSPRKPSPCCSW